MENMKKLLQDMNHRVTKTEEKLAITEDKLAEALNDLANTKYDLGVALNELSVTKEETKTELMITKTEVATTKSVLFEKTQELEKKIVTSKTDLMAKVNELVSELLIRREPPYMHACGSQNSYSNSTGTIPYSTLLYSSSNTEGGGLDIDTGIFTSPHPGSYTVSWGLYASEASDSAGYVLLFLQHNGVNIEESVHHSVLISAASVYLDDQGGRTLVLHLDMGDTLQLYCANCSAQIRYLSFCVSLTTPDII